MNRRDLLRASAAAVGGGTVVGTVALASDDASAQTALTLEVGSASATLGPDASVTAVYADVDVEWAYDLPDSATPSTVIVELAAAEGDAEPTVVASAESAQLFTDAEGSESFDVDLVGDVLDAAALAPAAGTRETPVTIEARLRVESDGGDVLARDSATDQATVTIERQADPSEYGSVGGSGTLRIETE